MEGEEQFSKKDWVEHLRWIIDDIDRGIAYNFGWLIPILTFIIVCILSIFANSYSLLGKVGLIISIPFLIILFSSIYELSGQREDFTILLNKILLGNITKVTGIEYEFTKISSKYTKQK